MLRPYNLSVCIPIGEKKGVLAVKRLLLVMTVFWLVGIGVGQTAVPSKNYNETANRLLKSAVLSDDLEQVKQAFAMGANPNYLQGHLDAPFTRAIRKSKSTGIVQCFIENGVDIHFESAGNGNYPSALAAAVGERRLDMAELLLNAGANPNHGFDGERNDGRFLVNVQGVTVVFGAVRSDKPIDLDILRLLIGKGADVNQADSLGNTPLTTACELGKVESVKILLANGANPNQANKKSEKPLDLARKSGNVELINLLIPITQK